MEKKSSNKPKRSTRSESELYKIKKSVKKHQKYFKLLNQTEELYSTVERFKVKI